jgi:hypothetical protein
MEGWVGLQMRAIEVYWPIFRGTFLRLAVREKSRKDGHFGKLEIRRRNLGARHHKSLTSSLPKGNARCSNRGMFRLAALKDQLKCVWAGEPVAFMAAAHPGCWTYETSGILRGVPK